VVDKLGIFPRRLIRLAVDFDRAVGPPTFKLGELRLQPLRFGWSRLRPAGSGGGASARNAGRLVDRLA
jgi:hypothetical protein